MLVFFVDMGYFLSARSTRTSILFYYTRQSIIVKFIIGEEYRLIING